MLLHLLKWLKENTAVEITILLQTGGPLTCLFEEIAETFLWVKPHEPTRSISLKRQVYNRILNKKIIRKTYHEILLADLQSKNFDLVYANTVVSLGILKVLKKFVNSPVICHIHEMQFSLKGYYNNLIQNEYLQLVDEFICVSNIAREGFVKNTTVCGHKITVVNEFIDMHNLVPSLKEKEIRNRLNLGDDFIVGASGTMDWRKGIDLFIKVFWDFKTLHPDLKIKFIWVGEINKVAYEGYVYESSLKNMIPEIIFTGAQPKPVDYFQAFNVFVLTSREDPFPLVCLEAAGLKKPIICFNKASGIPELIDEKSGICVEYGNTDEICKAILRLYNNQAECKVMGRHAYDQVQKLDVNFVAPTIYKLIEKCLHDSEIAKQSAPDV